MDYRDIHELYHHGIKGQKWGKRNGPPYPLDPEDHSKKEKQYLKKDEKTEKTEKKNRDAPKKNYDYDEFEQEIDRNLASDKTHKLLKSLYADERTFQEHADQLSDRYDKFYKSLMNNSDFDKECREAVKKSKADGAEAFYEVDKLIEKYIPKDLRDDYQKLNKERDSYQNKVNDLADTLFDKYKNSNVVSQYGSMKTEVENGRNIADRMLRQYIDIDYNFANYNDYWLSSLDSRFNLLDKYA